MCAMMVCAARYMGPGFSTASFFVCATRFHTLASHWNMNVSKVQENAHTLTHVGSLDFLALLNCFETAFVLRRTPQVSRAKGSAFGCVTAHRLSCRNGMRSRFCSS